MKNTIKCNRAVYNFHMIHRENIPSVIFNQAPPLTVEVCDATYGDRTYLGQIKGPIAKLTNLKYDVLMACLDRDIQT